MTLDVKICGLRDRQSVEAAIAAGADFAGLVFYPPSPRHVSFDQAGELADLARGRIGVVALAVDPDDAQLADIISAVNPDLLQLHGSESPERVCEIKSAFGVDIMKAVSVASARDLKVAETYRDCADMILYDAKPPPQGGENALPGGNGLCFDWRLMLEVARDRPYMLSGGLNPDNVAEAIRLTGAAAVDVSSGVERGRGIKDPARIHAFVAAARAGGASAAQKRGEETCQKLRVDRP